MNYINYLQSIILRKLRTASPLLLLVLSIGVLPGCSETLKILRSPVERPPVILIRPAKPVPITTHEVKFTVYGKKNWPKEIKKAQVCTTTEGYENLSHNMAEVTRFINQKSAEVRFYEELTLKEATTD